ncbi:hypothetical protein Moror_5840 [Moniliophthora roreri MCA 2997]|uniref:Uncharacterized protein n=2 Tax=Moniliophthora roreri TaxID=221103 RepID=V2X453_MONRO|nr:hypothetical protein Moror_5840 [Moniliophthora roreri MCA 2997]KAI3612244.1 hypothetical protein WG66_012079 [Moniliophthora roreri]
MLSDDFLYPSKSLWYPSHHPKPVLTFVNAVHFSQGKSGPPSEGLIKPESRADGNFEQGGTDSNGGDEVLNDTQGQ